MALITLTTDFGQSDHYVAAMKGVILSIAPRTTIVDVTHHVARGGIVQAAFILAQLPQTFPPGTVHAAVIDPTVGTGRKILAVGAGDQFFIAPDNGLLTLVQKRWGISALYAVVEDPSRPVSRTFHGRDLIAPAAARLALRGRLSELGPPVAQMELLNLPEAAESPGRDAADGQVMYIDHFGNCVTNVPAALVRQYVANAPGLVVYAGGRRIGPPVGVYADVPAGSPLALIGSAGLLEVAVNLGSAAELLGLAVGSPVNLRYERELPADAAPAA